MEEVYGIYLLCTFKEIGYVARDIFLNMARIHICTEGRAVVFKSMLCGILVPYCTLCYLPVSASVGSRPCEGQIEQGAPSLQHQKLSRADQGTYLRTRAR
jgi:hypothetical protein